MLKLKTAVLTLAVALLISCFLPFILFSQGHHELTSFHLLTEDTGMAPGAPNDNNPRLRKTILITNWRTDFHLEVLESLMAKFPLDLDSDYNFDFHIKRDSRSSRWMEYALNSTYFRREYQLFGGQRTFGTIIRKSSQIDTSNYTAIIEATCYCNEEFRQLIVSSPKTYCVFHEQCDGVMENPRAYWVHPSMPRYIFPNVMPQFGGLSKKRAPSKPYHLCMVGDPNRHDMNLVREFLGNYKRSHREIDLNSIIQLYFLGKGNPPVFLKRFSLTNTVKSKTPNHVEFQQLISTDCHAILALLTHNATPKYFPPQNKLSGAVVQASSYKIPLLLHRDLFPVYKTFLSDDDEELLHGDDPASFIVAMEHLLQRFEA